jgi:hypothetical protein
MKRNSEHSDFSGYAEEAFEPVAFLPKPFTLGQLVRAIKENQREYS